MPIQPCEIARRRLIYTEQVLADLERLADFLVEAEPQFAAETVGLIEEEVNVPRRHPLIDRPVKGALREIVISRGRSG